MWAIPVTVKPYCTNSPIESDASNKGWGAVLNDQTRTGGVWSAEEGSHHINYRSISILSGLREELVTTVLFHLDNVTAVTYINQKGGTTSALLCQLALTMWTWCVSRNIMLNAEHLPGHLNTIADHESRSIWDRCNWMLNQRVFQRTREKMGPLEVDLFASHLTKQLPQFYSWRADPEAVVTDAFMQDWSQHRGFANPPWCLIHRCLSKLKMQLALITPMWKTQSWYPIVLELLEDCSVTLPTLPDLVAIPGVSGETWSAPTDCLRQSDLSQGFSSEASSLMLASWRDKTNSNYSSFFAKWARWYHQRGRNSLSGPITDVINFLADLSGQGYQYQSLNSYHSAISSVHEAVDGVSVGAHPAIARVLFT